MSRPTARSSSCLPSVLSPKLDKNLAAYMLAAGAAGVSLIAAQSAEAKIVYTPAHTTIGPRTSFLLDLNHDGVNDFLLSNWQYGHASHLSIVREGSANAVLVKNLTYGDAADLPQGVQIGPNRPFDKDGFMAQQSSVSGISNNDGPWKDVQNRYLGLKFSINGETHYGWARLTVTTRGSIVATLTGYAYETAPNRGIVAGKTSGTEVVSAVGAEGAFVSSDRSASLGALACGADAFWIRRRDEEVTRSQG
jgi:hypothetical protein